MHRWSAKRGDVSKQFAVVMTTAIMDVRVSWSPRVQEAKQLAAAKWVQRVGGSVCLTRADGQTDRQTDSRPPIIHRQLRRSLEDAGKRTPTHHTPQCEREVHHSVLAFRSLSMRSFLIAVSSTGPGREAEGFR